MGVNMKDVYTAAEVARICNVTIRTVIKWYNSGILKGFKIPSTRDRRIPRENLISFMKENGFPLENNNTSNRKRILIADDEEGILFVLERFLGDFGIFDVATARSGREAVSKTVSFRPHVLIVDDLLGDTTCSRVVRSLRSNPELKNLKIIGMGGYLNDEEVDHLLKSGLVEDFLRKPFDLKEAKTKVFKLLELDINKYSQHN